MADSNKNLAVAGLASILLVAMVVVVAVTTGKDKTDNNLGASTKVIQAICSRTDYQDSCHKSVAHAKSGDPKDIVKAAFESTVRELESTITTSKHYKGDERSKQGLQLCEEVLTVSMKDLLRSLPEVGKLEMQHIHDVKTWLSGAIDHLETCIDGLENTSGDTGMKMRKLLESSSEMLSNNLALVDSVSVFIWELGMGNEQRRRLLWEESEGIMEESVKADVVVAQDGSGQFKTIMEAINAFPPSVTEPIVIHIKEGIYEEQVSITQNNIKLIGDGPSKTIISGNKSYVDGTLTYYTAVLGVNANNFMAKDLTVQNTAGAEKHQAVAVRADGDKQIYHNVVINGYQNTLYAHSYRQYYRDCVISGTIDFIFGDAQAIFQKCKLVVRKHLPKQDCIVIAQGRPEKRSLGVTVMQDSEFICDHAFTIFTPKVKAFLGRPWKAFSRTIIMQSSIDKCIAPKGWAPWNGNFALDTLYYGEYENRGIGSKTDARVRWKGIQHITPEIAKTYTGAKVLASDEWVIDAKVPYISGMMEVQEHFGT